MEEKKKNILIGILTGVIVLLIGVCLYLVLSSNKDLKNKPTNNDLSSNDTNSFVVKKTIESFYFNVILDTNGNAYLGMRDTADLNNDMLAKVFKNAVTYNYNDKSEKLVKVDLQNIKDIQTINYGNGGGKYIVFLNQNDKLYALLDFLIADNGNLTPLTDNSLNKVSSVYPECDEGGCLVYANAIINGKTEKISLYDLFEMYYPVDFNEIKQTLNKYSPSFEVSDGKIPKSVDITSNGDTYKVELASDGKVSISKNGQNKQAISNITNAVDISEGVNGYNPKVFIILNNGDVYEYSIEDFNNQKYAANKINTIKNATKFVTISYNRCAECGGDMLFGIIDKDNQYIELDSFSS